MLNEIIKLYKLKKKHEVHFFFVNACKHFILNVLYQSVNMCILVVSFSFYKSYEHIKSKHAFIFIRKKLCVFIFLIFQSCLVLLKWPKF